MSNEQLKRTPLFDAHVSLGGKIVPFAGWEMPVQYGAGVVEEHRAVRERVGLFDVSHMGEIDVKGPDTIPFLEKMTCNFVGGIADGQAQYTALTNPEGGVVDDIIIYRHSAEHFLLCVNASNADIDFAWISEHVEGDVSVENISSEYAQIAVQGPKAFALLKRVFGKDYSEAIKPFWFMEDSFQGQSVLVARTGYTGEDGVEVFVSPENASALWQELLTQGEADGVMPCGLGARDSLRLEVCYPLHGHELGPAITAIESGIGWVVKPKSKGEFLGRSVLEDQKKNGSPRTLVGFEVTDRGIVREGAIIQSESGAEIGFVTSGTKTPTVGKAIGLALVQNEFKEVGSTLQAVVRGKPLAIQVVQKPFYQKQV